ncbi:RNA polymerase sigma factor [Pinibacter soli]|uniref:RNA polymerase sigma factor n=1 Tax=Pinibacter soli TaxID=3044211 RepID=A0ABT6RGE7_9BACT|nr:RNA polymerase sigma factor [Pinibacter soli]MDI3321613.1 RNA polymerase sigma factor [Pinibacter soli]
MSAEIDTLITANTEDLKSFALKFTNHRESAEDLVQDTIYKALANKQRFSANSNVRAWLYTIMRNIFINNYRRKETYQTVLLKCYRKPEAGNVEFTLRNILPIELEIKEIKERIHALPIVFRESFLLHLEGFKYDEIAEMLNEPIGTIKSRIHFARKILKSRIERC